MRRGPRPGCVCPRMGLHAHETHGFARFSGEGQLPDRLGTMARPFLTSPISRLAQEMAYFMQKGRGEEDAKHKGRPQS